jgi:hypothetical protein
MQGTSWNTCRLGGLRCKAACFSTVHGRGKTEHMQQAAAAAAAAAGVSVSWVCHCARSAVLGAVSLQAHVA